MFLLSEGYESTVHHRVLTARQLRGVRPNLKVEATILVRTGDPETITLESALGFDVSWLRIGALLVEIQIGMSANLRMVDIKLAHSLLSRCAPASMTVIPIS